jgi:hypothetical protein
MAKINIRSWSAHSYSSICKGVALPRSFSNRKKSISVSAVDASAPHMYRKAKTSRQSDLALASPKQSWWCFVHAAWSRVKTIQRRQRRTTSLKPPGPGSHLRRHELWVSNPRPTRRASSFGTSCVRVRGNNGPWHSCGFTLLCALHHPRPRRLRPSHPLTFLRASQQFYGSWLQVPRAGCGLVELSPFVRRGRDKLRRRLNVITTLCLSRSLAFLN